MKRVYVDRDIKPARDIVAGFPDEWEVQFGLDPNEEELTQTLAEVEIILVTSRIPVRRELMEALPSLELIGKLGTGVDTIDLHAARDLDLPVVYTPGYNALSVAELALGLLLATARRFTEARRLLENGLWRDECTLGYRVTGKTVGIVGLGNVGKRFANLLRSFHVDLLYFDPYIPPIDGELVGGTPVDLDELLTRSDIVCLMPELTDETRGMIGSREIAMMGSNTIIVNTARGPVIDEQALIAALANDEIGGVGLDVFADEPLDPDSPLLTFDNVTVTPHIGPMTHEDRVKTISRLVNNVRNVAQGKQVPDEFIATNNA